LVDFLFFSFVTFQFNKKVEEQKDPNPDFPTVTFPNPEEGKGALTLAMKTADANSSPLILVCSF
jgi:phosphomannomutase